MCNTEILSGLGRGSILLVTQSKADINPFHYSLPPVKKIALANPEY